MRILFSIFSMLTIFSYRPTTSAQSKISSQNIALIYQGPGSCPDEPGSTGCTEAAANLAKTAGFQVIFVGPEGLADSEIWNSASVWIQPGGRARIQIQKISEALKGQIRNFVWNGGGYVGFCAGGFLATETFGWQDPKTPKDDFEATGLGLLKGYSRYYDEYDAELSKDHLAKILDVQWNNSLHSVYWELGPYFDETTLTADSGYVAIAFYPESPLQKLPAIKKAMTIKGNYGQGRVFVTAVHPEAPQDWRDYYKIIDNDGVDFNLGIEMIQWTKRKMGK